MPIFSWLRGRADVSSHSSERRLRRQSVSPRLEMLEDRLTPAVQLSYGGPGRALLLAEDGSGPTATVSISDGNTTTLTINLGTGTFSSASTVSTNGLTYENPGSPATSHSAEINIGSLGNISTLQAELAGDTLDLGILADIHGGVGSISASAATINVTSVNTTEASPANVSLTASGSLTVDTNGSVETGNGTITLAADINADGMGNTNTDPLTIDSGAAVVSTNTSASAITLRGAQMNIATGSNPAVVGAFPVLGTKPSATLKGLDGPGALAFDGSGNLFVANSKGTTVSEFAPGSTTPTATLSGLKDPVALAFDGNGDLFVANASANTVSEFAPGSTKPFATLKGLYGPDALAFDGSGNLFVANFGTNGKGTTVSEFAPGSTTPMTTLKGLDAPDSLVFDASGNLFVANYSKSTVSEFAPGKTTPMATLKGLASPSDLAFGGNGNLYVTNGKGTTVSEFAPGKTTPTVTLSGQEAPDALAFDSNGNLFVASYTSASGQGWSRVLDVEAFEFGSPDVIPSNISPTKPSNGTVSEFAPESTLRTDSLSGLDNPDALSFDPSGNLFVANFGNNTVSEFTPGNDQPVAGGVVLQTALPTEAMSIGGNITPPSNTLYLSNAELARIFTTSKGTVTFGGTSQTGNITFQDAAPATTGGASIVVTQSTAEPGGIFLDASKGTALSDSGGAIHLAPGTAGIIGTLSASNPLIMSKGFSATGLTLNLSLSFAPTLNQQITVIDDTSSTAFGAFANLPSGQTTTASDNGTSYSLTARYAHGPVNELVVTAPPVAMAKPTNITSSSATLNGFLNAASGSPILASGILYAMKSANSTPSLTKMKGVTKLTGPTTSGAFSIPATDLKADTNFVCVTYVTTSKGTTYSAFFYFATMAAQ